MAKVELGHSGVSSPLLRGLREREALSSLPGTETSNVGAGGGGWAGPGPAGVGVVVARRSDWLA